MRCATEEGRDAPLRENHDVCVQLCKSGIRSDGVMGVRGGNPRYLEGIKGAALSKHMLWESMLSGEGSMRVLTERITCFISSNSSSRTTHLIKLTNSLTSTHSALTRF